MLFRYRGKRNADPHDVSVHNKARRAVRCGRRSGWFWQIDVLRCFWAFETPEYARSSRWTGSSELDLARGSPPDRVVLQDSKAHGRYPDQYHRGQRPLLDRDDAWEAARMAGIEDDIQKMPMGMRT